MRHGIAGIYRNDGPQRQWLVSHRSHTAQHWNVLSTLTVGALRDAS